MNWFKLAKVLIIVGFGMFAYVSFRNAAITLGLEAAEPTLGFAAVLGLATLFYCMSARKDGVFVDATLRLIAIVVGMYVGAIIYKLATYGGDLSAWRSVESLGAEGAIYVVLVFINTFHYAVAFGWWMVLARMTWPEFMANSPRQHKLRTDRDWHEKVK